MDAIKLKEAIQVVMNKELRNLSKLNFERLGDRKYALIYTETPAYGKPYRRITEYHAWKENLLPPVLYVQEDYEVKLIFENLDILIDIYNIIKDKNHLKTDFVYIIQNFAKNHNDYDIPSLGYLAFETLIKIGKFDEAISLIEIENLKWSKQFILYSLYEGGVEILSIYKGLSV